jgi:hypothetical protein
MRSTKQGNMSDNMTKSWNMTSIITRRHVLTGLIAAPAVVAYSNIMPVRAVPLMRIVPIFPRIIEHRVLGPGVVSFLFVHDDGTNTWIDMANLNSSVFDGGVCEQHCYPPQRTAR